MIATPAVGGNDRSIGLDHPGVAAGTLRADSAKSRILSTDARSLWDSWRRGRDQKHLTLVTTSGWYCCRAEPPLRHMPAGRLFPAGGYRVGLEAQRQRWGSEDQQNHGGDDRERPGFVGWDCVREFCPDRLSSSSWLGSAFRPRLSFGRESSVPMTPRIAGTSVAEAATATSTTTPAAYPPGRETTQSA